MSSKYLLLAAAIGTLFAILHQSRAGSCVAQPFFEVVPVDTGFPNASVLPGLGQADDGTIYCAFSAHTATIMVISSADGGKTYSEPVKAIKKPRDSYICDAKVFAREVTNKVSAV